MDLVSFFAEIHAIARTKVQPQFRDSFPERVDITKEAFLEPVDADTHSCSGLDIPGC